MASKDARRVAIDWAAAIVRRQNLRASPESLVKAKSPCLYPLDDGRRCLECKTCQPTFCEDYSPDEAMRLAYWAALAEISDLFDGHGWEDADADELREQVEQVVGIVNRVLPRTEIEAAQEANDAA